MRISQRTDTHLGGVAGTLRLSGTAVAPRLPTAQCVTVLSTVGNHNTMVFVYLNRENTIKIQYKR